MLPLLVEETFSSMYESVCERQGIAPSADWFYCSLSETARCACDVHTPWATSSCAYFV